MIPLDPAFVSIVDSIGIDVSDAGDGEVSLAALAPDIGVRDWDCLFSAVCERLRSTVGERFATEHEAQGHDTAIRVRADVRECLEALDQLHASLTHERRRRQQLETKLLIAQTSLAQARAELADTEEGEMRARRLGLHDGLTALPNRSFFRWRLDHALSHTERERQTLAVLYLDLDGFKPINDVHGHDAGDELLRIVAARLTRAMRAEDMVSRMGGDEFACLRSGLQSRDQLTRLVGKLMNVVSAPLKFGSIKVTVRPSIGIAMSPGDGATAEALLKNADAAMYSAKRQRTGYAFFSDCVAA